MAKVYLDANYLIGVSQRVPEIETEMLDKHQGFISILTCHIYFYISKIAVPDKKANDFLDDFNIVNLTLEILSKARQGPTNDLEDNIQLFSALKTNCDVFLTFDKSLLKMKLFGDMKIASTLEAEKS